MPLTFQHITVDELDHLPRTELDALSFGVIGFDDSGEVRAYSATESRLAGLSPDRVVGRHFFAAVAPCMNNFMVAQRFEDENNLDETIDYVLTLRMRPTPVKLRLLKEPGATLSYVLVQR
jgi:photoactive yellow protein